MRHSLWRQHPAVRTENELTLGERAADRVKSALGSWMFIGVQTLIFGCWVTLNIIAWAHHWDPYPFILLNLMLSTQAAYAAPVLQLSQNRNDRISAEVALHTKDAVDSILTELAVLQHVNAELNVIREAVSSEPNPAEGVDSDVPG